jgi:Arc/MetJ-type ribon-helix-helix transcriptional regulator
MTLTLPPDLEQHVNNLVRRGDYPSTEAVLVDAVKALVREQERQRIEPLLEANGIDENRLVQLDLHYPIGKYRDELSRQLQPV